MAWRIKNMGEIDDLLSGAEKSVETQIEMDKPTSEQNDLSIAPPAQDPTNLVDVPAPVAEETIDPNYKKQLIEPSNVVPTLSEKTPQENQEEYDKKKQESGLHKNMNGQTLTIKSWKLLQPKTEKKENGVVVKVEPTISKKNPECRYYTAKLALHFEEENVVGYYGSINYFLDKEGAINPNVSLFRDGKSRVAHICKIALIAMAKEGFKLDKPGTFQTEKIVGNDGGYLIDVVPGHKPAMAKYSAMVKDSEILNFLIGRKVDILATTGDYNGPWFRNDFLEIKAK